MESENYLVTKERSIDLEGSLVMTETWKPLTPIEASNIRLYVETRREQLAALARPDLVTRLRRLRDGR